MTTVSTRQQATLRSILHSDFFNRIPNLRRDSKEIIKSEFVILLLNLMGKVDDKDILLASKIFDKLDRECDGTYVPVTMYVCMLEMHLLHIPKERDF